MTDWVQYHNPAKNPPFGHEDGYFGIYTTKPVGTVKPADRVWVVTSSGERPKHYQLVQWFEVEEVEANMPAEENIVSGSHGRFYSRAPRIDQEPWFTEFLKVMGNFGRGFSSISDKRFIEGLEAAAAILPPSSRSTRRPTAR
jgi:hypothetical protein